MSIYITCFEQLHK